MAAWKVSGARQSHHEKGRMTSRLREGTDDDESYNKEDEESLTERILANRLRQEDEENYKKEGEENIRQGTLVSRLRKEQRDKRKATTRKTKRV